MISSNNRLVMLVLGLLLLSVTGHAQESYTLQQCLGYAVEHNSNVKKSALDREKAERARQEVLGALLPQISGSAGLNDNLKKAKFIMPNFMNNFLPEKMRDPNASEYMTIEMGTKYSANAGLALNQQLLNMSLFNTLDIAKVSKQMAELGALSTEEDVIAQTATLYYGVQVTQYAASQMLRSVELVEQMLRMMEVNYASGLVKKVDVDRLRVNLTNLKTQQSAIESGLEVQKNLLKLQMGFEVTEPMTVPPLDLGLMAQQEIATVGSPTFDPIRHIAYMQLQQRERMAELQERAKKYEYLPTLSLALNLQYNHMRDQLFGGATNYGYPTAMVGVSLRMPIFSGGSRLAKVRESHLDLLKAQEDLHALDQSLRMANLNASLKLRDTQRTISLQRDNQTLAEQVLDLAQKNYNLGVASLSDVLNASQSLVQAQMSYASALGDYMKAFIDLKKSRGEIRDLME
ncbi:TolC family protein [uncultured Porphyromonas sp.]|uniref:TolC family protein n=1 Tax=uncultured Porphyromonas sp. TaxID=159274 RepID=UPI0026055D88|nr:TolC family protein [uncultured Porphyromonas sp.]